MARGGRSGKKRTQYVRDAQGQFASTPGGGKKATPSAVRKAAKAATLKGGTLAARTSLKKSRAKLKSIDKADPTLQASLSKRAQKGAVTRGSKNLTKAIKSSRTRLTGAKPNANTIKKKRPVSMAYILKDVTRSMSPDDAQRVLGKKPLAKRKINATVKTNTIKKKRSPILEAKPLQKPAAERPGSMTSILKNTLRTLAQADAQRIREIESITGQKIKPIKQRAAAIAAGDRVRSTVKGGKVADTLRAGLRELAQSDARTMREMSKIVKDATPKVAGAKERGKVKGSAKSRAMIKTEHGGSLVDPVKREPRKAPNRIGISRKGFAQIKKPANLAAGGIERAKLAKASKDYRKIDKRMSRRDANYRRLQSEMSLAVMRRDQNPYPKGMAGKKEKVRRQGEVDKIQKRINKQNMAWMTYSLQQKSVDEALKLISQIRANAKLLKKTTKKRARYQGSLLGGTDVSY